MLIQLEIDFSVPYELTPTHEEIMWIMQNYGTFSVPFVEIKAKRNKKRRTKQVY